MMATRSLGKVLLTGAGGFLGLALTRRLRTDGVPLVTSDLSSGDIPCDLTDPEAVMALLAQGPFDTVLHCGAVSGPMVMADRPLEIWRINASGTAHLLEAARRHGAGRVLICSTTEVYGCLTGQVSEETLPAPVSVYAASKLAAENAMTGYVREHGIDAVALRLSWIYGPGRTTPTMLERMLRAAIEGKPASFDAHPGDLTHYLYIDDAVGAILCAAQKTALPRMLYNVSAGPGRPLGTIVEEILEIRPAAKISLTGSHQPQALPSVIANELCATELGYSNKISMKAGLSLYLDALDRA